MADNAGRVHGIAGLPNELLTKVWSYLDSPAPSVARLRYQPVFELTESENTALKDVSCVSPGLRQSVLRIVFRHVRLRLRDGTDFSKPGWDAAAKALLQFLKKNDLASIVDTFTFVAEGNEQQNYHGQEIPQNGFDAFWHSLFEAIDPLRLTIAAPPSTLAALTSCSISTRHMADYFMPYQILSLNRDRSPRATSTPALALPTPLPILEIRPWAHLLLNEGSFIRAYSVCQQSYQSADPPSLLPDLVKDKKAPPNQPVLPFSIRGVAYVGIFPFASHVHHLTRLFSRLDRLFVQLTPQSDLLPDRWQTAQADFMDMSVQRDQCYRVLLHELFDPQLASFHRFLKEVECGDGDSDPGAWTATAEQTTNAVGSRWRLERPGLLVNDSRQ